VTDPGGTRFAMKISPTLQGKLLRVLEDETFRRLGGIQPRYARRGNARQNVEPSPMAERTVSVPPWSFASMNPM
jgi:hypothetical protein